MDTFPLSHAQQRIWYAQQKYRKSPLFNVGGLVKIYGEVDTVLLVEAIKHVIDFKECLRINLISNSDLNAQQYISNHSCVVEYFDFSQEKDPEKTADEFCEKSLNTAMEMTLAPLHYFVVIKITNEIAGYFVKLHHIIADGWSMKLITEQIKDTYECFKINTPRNEFPESSYKQYIIDENEKIEKGLYEKDRLFWSNTLSRFPDEFVEKCNQLSGMRISYRLDEELHASLLEFISKHNLSINSFFVALYILYKYKASGLKDNIIGVPMLGRANRKERNIVGTFTNPLPFRYVLDNELSLLELFNDISGKLKKMYVHQKYPADLIRADLHLDEKNIESLYDVSINYYNTTLPKVIDNNRTVNTEFYNGEQEYNMQVIIRHWDNDTLQLDFDVKTSVYTKKTVETLFNQLLVLMRQVLGASHTKVYCCSFVITEDKKKYLEEFNNTQQQYDAALFVDTFYNVVKQYPNNIALSHNTETLTYEELESRINNAMHHLRNNGLSKGDIIAMIPDYTTTSVVLIMAVLLCGAVYMPISADTPSKKKKELLDSSGAKYLIAEDAIEGIRQKCFEPSSLVSVCTNKVGKTDDIKPNDLAYIIYTSGSTGVPKGVIISHGSIMNYLNWAKQTYIKQDNEIFPLYSSFAFDFTLTSIFLPLVTGNELRIYDKDKDANVFKRILGEAKATIIKITPSHIELINHLQIDTWSVHTFIIGGENLKTETCRELYEKFDCNVTIYNEYGPTEATIGCMIYQYKNNEKDKSVPIGIPIANTQIYLLDNDMQPVSDEMLGELYLSGNGLALGYLHDVDETKRKFINSDLAPSGIIYKTGDMAYRNRDGDVVFYGRLDNEVKIRAYRVNLNEIENSILSSGLVKDVIVCLKNIESSSYLYACLIPTQLYNEKELLAFLRERLADYMIPQILIEIEAFPLTVNGKVDKSKLPDSKYYKGVESEKAPSKHLSLLIGVMQEVFKNSSLHELQNFFAIGGDSIKAIKISSRLYEMGYDLSLADILSNPDFADLARKIKVDQVKENDFTIKEGFIKNTPITSWFFHQSFTKRGQYNQSVLLKLKKAVDIDALNQVFATLILYHDALRINVKDLNRMFYNNEHLKKDCIVETVQCKCENIINFVEEKFHIDFDLEQDLLIKPYFIQNAPDNYIYISIHHLCIDAVSWRILLSDIQHLLDCIKTREALHLVSKTDSVQAFANVYNDYFRNTTDAKDQMGIKQYATKYRIDFEISGDIIVELFGDCNIPFNTRPEDIILVVTSKTISECFSLSSVVCEIESHGRDIIKNININRTMGWFTGIKQIVIQSSAADLEEYIMQVKEKSREAISENGRGVNSNLVSLWESLPILRYNYLGSFVEELGDYFSDYNAIFNCDIAKENKMPYEFEINIIKKSDTVTISFISGLQVLDPLKFREKFLENLQMIVAYCCNRADKRLTPSDFCHISLSQEELDLIQAIGVEGA